LDFCKKERIGSPELFIGRKEELAFFLNWINNIKKEVSLSTAMLARRKMGKTVILERLLNITFEKNDGVIPLYYEILATEKYIVDFCVDFFLSFSINTLHSKQGKEYISVPHKVIVLPKQKTTAKKWALPIVAMRAGWVIASLSQVKQIGRQELGVSFIGFNKTNGAGQVFLIGHVLLDMQLVPESAQSFNVPLQRG
jgi:hypothetical protein